MKRILAAALATLVGTTTALAAPAIVECGEPAKVLYTIEPLTKSTRAFANGNIRVFHTDTFGEPVCCSSYLIIVAPNPDDELGGAQCKMLVGREGAGFTNVSVPKIKASYSSSKGLLLKVPVQYYDPSGTGDVPGPKETIGIRINQATGSIAIE